MIVKSYRGTVSAEEAEELANRGIYVVNHLCVGSREHAEYAFQKMQEVFKRGKNIAKKKHLELMLILSGRRQIREALALCGVENAEGVVAISSGDFYLPLEEDPALLECSPGKLEHLGIVPVREKECEMFFENSALLELSR